MTFYTTEEHCARLSLLMGQLSKSDCFTIKTMSGEPMHATHGLASLSLFNLPAPPVSAQPGALVWGSFAWVLARPVTLIFLYHSRGDRGNIYLLSLEFSL